MKILYCTVTRSPYINVNSRNVQVQICLSSRQYYMTGKHYKSTLVVPTSRALSADSFLEQLTKPQFLPLIRNTSMSFPKRPNTSHKALCGGNDGWPMMNSLNTQRYTSLHNISTLHTFTTCLYFDRLFRPDFLDSKSNLVIR